MEWFFDDWCKEVTDILYSEVFYSKGWDKNPEPPACLDLTYQIINEIITTQLEPFRATLFFQYGSQVAPLPNEFVQEMIAEITRQEQRNREPTAEIFEEETTQDFIPASSSKRPSSVIIAKEILKSLAGVEGYIRPRKKTVRQKRKKKQSSD